VKGPGHRSRYEVRRVWECPVCHKRQKTTGQVVNLACDCRAKEEPGRTTWMHLVEDLPRPIARRSPPPEPSGEATV
jgi:hypothetical protein